MTEQPTESTEPTEAGAPATDGAPADGAAATPQPVESPAEPTQAELTQAEPADVGPSGAEQAAPADPVQPPEPAQPTPASPTPASSATASPAPDVHPPDVHPPDVHAPDTAAASAADGSDTGSEPAPAGDTAGTPPAAPRPTPKPGRVPTPAALARSARPRPGGPSAPRRPQPAVPTAAPVAPQPSTEELAARAREWGRVAEDGTVYVRVADGERAVGSYPETTDAEALAYFARKYDDLAAQLDLAEQRLSVPDAPVKDVAKALETLRPSLAEAHAVGDLAALDARLAALDELVAARRKEAEQRRAAAKEVARAERLALVEEAEQIAGTDPARMQWKPSGDRLRELFDLWKEAQRTGQRLDKPVEEELWKRFSHARTAFDRARRHHFAELEKRHGEVKAVKAKIVAEAQALATSTDWGPTSAAFRGLMDRWKAAGRAARKDDDALWAQFRSAQDQFFSARSAEQAQQDDEFRQNLVVKEQLLTEAEALLPVTDLDAAKRALRDIQDRWESAGKVPRADLGRIEKRMRAVEQAVRGVEDDQWKRTNPEARARAEGALGQLEDSISALESDLAAARERGDTRKVAEAEEALTARRAWLEQVRRAADDFSG